MKTQTPAKYVFTAIWIVLLVLLLAIRLLAHLRTSALPILVIAGIQMFLVLAFFMGLRRSNALVRVFAAAGFLWLLLMGLLVFADYLTRQWH